MAVVRNQTCYTECVVSYLAIHGPARFVDDSVASGASGILDTFHHFTRCDGHEATGDFREPGVVVDCLPDAAAGHVVRARPIRPHAGNAPLVRELVDLLHIQLRCLTDGMAIRGAVVVDFVHLGPNGNEPLSGPALAGRARSRAREMEANEVNFPRIAVGEEIVRRLKSDESLWTQDANLRAEMELIECMMAADDAGQHYIDYLRAGLGDFDYDFDRYAEFLGRHKRFVEAGLGGASNWGTSVACDWLKNYHNARIDEDIQGSGSGAVVDACGRAMAAVLTPLRIA